MKSLKSCGLKSNMCSTSQLEGLNLLCRMPELENLLNIDWDSFGTGQKGK